MKLLAALLLISSFGFTQEHPKDRDADRPRSSAASTCVTTTFFGNVKKGLPFTQVIGSGLTYRLAPFLLNEANPAAAAVPPSDRFIGWTIEVAYLKKKGEMEREFSWVMTPPFRQWNARQLNTSYGHSIADVLKADHTVYFPLEILDYAQADKMVTRILWRSSPEEVQEAARELPRIPVGSAELSMLGQQLEGVPGDPTAIESLSFRVQLTIPTSVKLTPALAAQAKPAACPVSPVVPLLREMQQ